MDKKSHEKIVELLGHYGEETEILIWDGFADALIGIASDPAVHHELRAVYSSKKMVSILQTEHGMDHEESLEHFFYNIEGAWLGIKTPILIGDLNGIDENSVKIEILLEEIKHAKRFGNTHDLNFANGIEYALKKLLLI